MSRPRACAAVLQNDHILMVYHQDAVRSYWTLPGGGVEPGETPEEAALREVWEETGLQVRVRRLLFEESYLGGSSICSCFLAEVVADTMPHVGYDPEEAHLASSVRTLQGVAWHRLSSVCRDGQVARVLEALT